MEIDNEQVCAKSMTEPVVMTVLAVAKTEFRQMLSAMITTAPDIITVSVVAKMEF